MKIKTILKTAGAIIGMGITTIAAGKFGDIASKTWNGNDWDDNSYDATPENLDEIDDEEIKTLVGEEVKEETETEE